MSLFRPASICRRFRATAPLLGLLTALSLSGCGNGGSPASTSTAQPQLSVSASALTFGSQTVGTTSAAQTLLFFNTGSSVLTFSQLPTLADTANWSANSTCSTSLPVAGSCTVAVTFRPQSAATLSTTLSFASNASTQPPAVALSGTGTGTTSAVNRTLYTFPEADNSVTPLYALVNGAQHTIDMTMYALQDTTFSADLVAACARGVKVRVILDQNLEKSSNTPAFTQLNAATNCSAVWANTAFQATHQKSLLIDSTQAAVMSLNLQSKYYSTTRDFALLTTDTADIAAIQATFNADYAAGTTASGTVGASDFSYAPPPGTDLIWSPTTAQASMLALINNAKSTLILENEEMGASNIVSALQSACSRGVNVRIAMVNQSSYATNFKALENSGCGVHVYPDTTTGFYIHAKAVVADYGLSTQSVYMGSINYSTASMTQNRELGVFLTDTASIQSLYSTLVSDYNGGTAY